MEKDALYHLGPNQRMILELLRKKTALTISEIAPIIYKKPVPIGSAEYTAISRSLRGLLAKGLIEKTVQEVRWSLKVKSRG